jgi:CRP/FNR family transcriptional regulator, cyclic AMP receptor protein
MRSARDYRDLFRTGRWFSGLPEPFADGLLAAGQLRTLAAGEVLFSRGDQPSGLFGLVDGAVRVSGMSESGKEALLTLLEPPGWFGEISVFDGQPRTHDAIADGESRVVQVPQGDILRMLDTDPRWWRDLALLATSKLRLAFIAMEDMVLLPIAQRLARRLSLMAEGYGERRTTSNTVEVSQDQLAMMVSTSRQTANQVLKDFEQKGLIRLAYGSIEILDFVGLRRLTEGDG